MTGERKYTTNGRIGKQRRVKPKINGRRVCPGCHVNKDLGTFVGAFGNLVANCQQCRDYQNSYNNERNRRIRQKEIDNDNEKSSQEKCDEKESQADT